MFELLKSNQTGVLARGSLAKGLLAGKPSSAYLDYRVEAVRKMQDALGQIAPSPKHLFKIALQFVLGRASLIITFCGSYFQFWFFMKVTIVRFRGNFC